MNIIMENEIVIKLGNLLNEVRNKKPLVHNITNYVTVNDCANKDEYAVYYDSWW